jgi:acyl-CoA reductase-like NAD-dependent aldehyde dehydrogenase
MIAPIGPRQIEVREPANGNPLGAVESATPDTVEASVARARGAQRDWANLSSLSRAQYLLRWRSLVVERGSELATQLSRENGKPYHEALMHEVVALAEALDFIAEQAPVLQREHPSTPRWFKHRAHRVLRRPRGVVAILSPFNFPLLIPGADCAAALAMGCAAVLKPSPVCPLSAEHLVNLAHRAGIPEDVLQIVHGGADVGRALIESSVQEVVFTGSVENGRQVARECGSRLIACTLELGGNCPMLVLDDADIERTARAAAFGAFTNSGQSCLAVGRMLVPRRLMDPLFECLGRIVERLRQGDPASRDVDLGALSTRVQVERSRYHVEQAKRSGARSFSSRTVAPSQGNFFPPTLLAGCSADCAAVVEETFGPVLPMVAYDDQDEAVRLLNRGPFGLTAYVFGTDLERARQVAESLDFGHVVVDQVLLTYVCPELPLAGLRDSGLGVVHGTDGLLAHTTASVIGAPRVRLPTSLEFDWGDPKRALALAEGYLTAKSAWNRVLGWAKPSSERSRH